MRNKRILSNHTNNTTRGGNRALTESELKFATMVMNSVALALMMGRASEAFPKTMAHADSMLRKICPEAYDENGKAIDPELIQYHTETALGPMLVRMAFDESIETGSWEFLPNLLKSSTGAR